MRRWLVGLEAGHAAVQVAAIDGSPFLVLLQIVGAVLLLTGLIAIGTCLGAACAIDRKLLHDEDDTLIRSQPPHDGRSWEADEALVCAE